MLFFVLSTAFSYPPFLCWAMRAEPAPTKELRLLDSPDQLLIPGSGTEQLLEVYEYSLGFVNSSSLLVLIRWQADVCARFSSAALVTWSFRSGSSLVQGLGARVIGSGNVHDLDGTILTYNRWATNGVTACCLRMETQLFLHWVCCNKRFRVCLWRLLSLWLSSAENHAVLLHSEV